MGDIRGSIHSYNMGDIRGSIHCYTMGDQISGTVFTVITWEISGEVIHCYNMGDIREGYSLS